MNIIKSNATSKIYRRGTIDTLQLTTSRSLAYWRSQARAIFARWAHIDTVECVVNGRKTSSQILPRGEQIPPDNVHIIVASTGGKWGRSRREYASAVTRTIGVKGN